MNRGLMRGMYLPALIRRLDLNIKKALFKKKRPLSSCCKPPKTCPCCCKPIQICTCPRINHYESKKAHHCKPSKPPSCQCSCGCKPRGISESLCPPRKRKGGLLGLLTKLIFLTSAATIGVLAYAQYDPEFRQKILDQVPCLEPFFDKLYGDPCIKKKPAEEDICLKHGKPKKK